MKYPELANKEEWTPRMVYIHRRAMVLGLCLGAALGVTSTTTVLLIGLAVGYL